MIYTSSNNKSVSQRFCSLTSALAIVMLFTGCMGNSTRDADEKGIVATVGSFEISDKHFTNYLKRFYLRTGQAVNLNEEARLGVINGRIERYAIVEFARDQGWATDADAFYNRVIIERKVMMETYEQHFIHDRVQITDADLRDVFLRYNTQLRASHLRATNRYEAQALYDRLLNGESFENLAREVFRNPALAQSGGDLGYFSIDEMDLAFEDQAYAMNVGDISQPVRTSTGFSIIKLTERVSNPLLTESMFAQRKPALQQVAHRQRTEMATRNDIAEFVENTNWNRQVIRDLWATISENPDVYRAAYFSLNEIPLEFSDEFRSLAVASGPGFRFTVADFLAEAYYTPAERRARAEDFYQFEEQVEGMAYRYRALGLVNKLPNLDKEFIAESIEETFYSYLLSRFDSYLRESVVVTDQEVYQTFLADPSQFESPLQLNMAEIVVSDPETAQEVIDQMENGMSFQAALRRYGARVNSYANNGEIGFRSIQEFGTMAPVIKDITPGEFMGPFQITDQYFVILKCIGRTDPRPLSFEEAQESIRDYLKFTKQQRERVRMVEEMRHTYNAAIDMARLNTLSFEL